MYLQYLYPAPEKMQTRDGRFVFSAELTMVKCYESIASGNPVFI